MEILLAAGVQETMTKDIMLISAGADKRKLDMLTEHLAKHKLRIIEPTLPSPDAGQDPLVLAWGVPDSERDAEWRRLTAEYHAGQAGYDGLLIPVRFAPDATLPDLLTYLDPLDLSEWTGGESPEFDELVERVRYSDPGWLCVLRHHSLGALLDEPMEALHDLQVIAEQIGALAPLLSDDNDCTKPLMATLDEIGETYRVVKRAIERFVAAGLGSPQSMLASYSALERGVLAQSIRSGRAHCGRIWTRYAAPGGLRDEMQRQHGRPGALAWLDRRRRAQASADATFQRLRKADYYLFNRMDSIGVLLTGESCIIVRYLLNGEEKLARRRILQAREQLLVLESSLDAALADFQEIEETLGYAEQTQSKQAEVHMSIHIGGDVVNSNVVAADTISRSSLTVASTAVPEDLRATLTELHKAVASLTLALPDDEAELAAKDLEDLTREATSGHRPAFLRRAADGLLAAAGTVAQVGIPVAELVAKIMALV
jgi:hypothetical protein